MSAPCQTMNRFIKYYHAHKDEIRARNRATYAANREVEVVKRRQRYSDAPLEVVEKHRAKEPCPHCGVDKNKAYIPKHVLKCKQRPA